METELEELRARSTELAGQLDGEEALEVNAAILDLAPGDRVATNRLGIGLLRNYRFPEAIAVLENGLRVHPEDEIMNRRLEEAQKSLARGATAPVVKTKRSPPSNQGAAWTDFEPAELVESALRGPGRDACIRMCAASIRASEAIDASRTAVMPIKQGRRFRTIGGIFTGVGPWKDTLTVAVPVARQSVIGSVTEVGGFTLDAAKAIPSIQVAVPRANVEALYDQLLDAHVEHLKLSLAYAPPTHMNKHHVGLRRYLLEQADLLEA